MVGSRDVGGGVPVGSGRGVPVGSGVGSTVGSGVGLGSGVGSAVGSGVGSAVGDGAGGGSKRRSSSLNSIASLASAMNWRQIGPACVDPKTSVSPSEVISALPSVVPTQTAAASARV